jgi:hypothetical protein
MSGARPARPSQGDCHPRMPEAVWRLIQHAWDQLPAFRPSMQQLEERIRLVIVTDRLRRTEAPNDNMPFPFRSNSVPALIPMSYPEGTTSSMMTDSIPSARPNAHTKSASPTLPPFSQLEAAAEGKYTPLYSVPSVSGNLKMRANDHIHHTREKREQCFSFARTPD